MHPEKDTAAMAYGLSSLSANLLEALTLSAEFRGLRGVGRTAKIDSKTVQCKD